ncbi:low-temperature viability protein ltv1 [Grosmannia clavigera kw1407]|uniref:Low-temperature viability protein ltv1 n=1 Tax=Grosmannia clavigera (strain kw1407 / UAMH 11150) TaxID=655863 RepID=F0XRB2_GROCL|nr:low-temperature viability protein ltv1 [Grosmannia clavigera kw1407]EFW99854.1 low-temperature viability protein ltv1 [Grosmannia clavigera kw1407]
MPRRKWIDKKSASHFTLVHRPQNDPRIHDESAPAMVLNPTETPNAHKSKKLDELASQLGEEAEQIRSNEGEAANYGVYFDDSSYDYMQHLREIGSGGGEAVFVESSASLNKDKGKQKQPLAEALKQMDLQDRSEDLLDEDILPSKNLQRVTYQNQQDVPDVIAGFKPDMDPRLREVLEALEDEEYVDDNDDDLFKQLAKDGEELDVYAFEDTYSEQAFDDEDDEGWESDATERPAKARSEDGEGEDQDRVPDLVDTATTGNGPRPSEAWMEDFNQFKKDQKDQTKTRKPIVPAMSEIQSSIWTTTTNGGRKKKRKGALTQQSGFSMTSSSLVRTEQLTLLDARFDKIDELYNEDMDDMKSVSAFSSASSVQGPMRGDFDNIMDDFLGGYSMQGKRSIRKGRPQTGIEQLEEIRQGLGPARLTTRRK